MSGYRSLWIICALYMSTNYVIVVNAMSVQGMEENCILSFIVPKEKVKSSCQTDEKVNRRISAVEMKVTLYKQQVSDLQIELNKQRKLNTEKLETLEREVRGISANMGMNVLLERRLALLEKGFAQFNKGTTSSKVKTGKLGSTVESGKPDLSVLNAIDSSPTIVSNVVKTLIQSEVTEFFHNFSKRVESYVQEQIFLYNRVFNTLPSRKDSSTQYSENSALSDTQTSHLKNGDEVETISKQPRLKDGTLIESFDKMKVKLNYTGDKIAKHFGSYMQNITGYEYTDITESDQIVIPNRRKNGNQNLIASSEHVLSDDLSDHKEPFSGENSDANDTSLDDLFTSPSKDTSRSASSRISHNSKTGANTTGPEFLDAGEQKIWKTNREQYYNKIFEAESRLKDEINVMLSTSVDQVIGLVEKQNSALEDKLKFQDQKCEQINRDLTAYIQELENSVKTTNLQLQALSVGFKDLFSKADRIHPLETLINEIKHNMTINRTASLIENEEQSKKFKKLERLMGVYHQSLDHYRNETKHEYREIRSSLDKESNTLQAFSTSLFHNVTNSVSHDILRLNNSHMTRFQEITDQIRSHEETLILVQIDIENTEKLLANRPKRSDRDFENLQETVNGISVMQRDLKKKIDQIEQTQAGIGANISNYAKEFSGLKTEVKLSLDEWLPLTFEFDSSRTECFGDQYVKRTHYSKAKLVGVVLCSPTRYKIFLSTSLQNTFWNIGDGNGMGEDHCEFVGGNKDFQVKLSPFKPSFGAVQGYARNQWGQEPVVTYLNAIKPSPHWYECGTKIP